MESIWQRELHRKLQVYTAHTGRSSSSIKPRQEKAEIQNCQQAAAQRQEQAVWYAESRRFQGAEVSSRGNSSRQCPAAAGRQVQAEPSQPRPPR